MRGKNYLLDNMALSGHTFSTLWLKIPESTFLSYVFQFQNSFNNVSFCDTYPRCSLITLMLHKRIIYVFLHEVFKSWTFRDNCRRRKWERFWKHWRLIVFYTKQILTKVDESTLKSERQLLKSKTILQKYVKHRQTLQNIIWCVM